MEPSDQFQQGAPKKSPARWIIGCAVAGGVLLLALRMALILCLAWQVGNASAFLPQNVSPDSSAESTPSASQEENQEQPAVELPSGYAMENGAYRLTCQEYVEAFESQLSRLRGEEFSLVLGPSNCYQIWREGAQTQSEVQLRFYQSPSQVSGSERFQIVEVFSTSGTTMDSLIYDVCAVSVYLADPTFADLSAAEEWVRDWDEENRQSISYNSYCTCARTTPGGVSGLIRYVTEQQFQCMQLEDYTKLLGGSPQ